MNFEKNKNITIGGTDSTSLFVISKICKQFNEHYPETHITIDVGEYSTRYNMVEKLSNGDIDILINQDICTEEFSSITLFEEHYLFIIRKDYPGIDKLSSYSLSYNEVLTGEYPEEKIIDNWNLFKNINVFKPGHNQPVKKIFSDFYKSVAHKNIDIKNFRRMDIQYILMDEGIGGLLQPQSIIINKGYDPDKHFCFAFNDEGNTRKTTLLYKTNNMDKSLISEFIKIAKEIYN